VPVIQAVKPSNDLSVKALQVVLPMEWTYGSRGVGLSGLPARASWSQPKMQWVARVAFVLVVWNEVASGTTMSSKIGLPLKRVSNSDLSQAIKRQVPCEMKEVSSTIRLLLNQSVDVCCFSG